VRIADFAGFEATEDLQDLQVEHQEEEVDAASDIDSDEELKPLALKDRTGDIENIVAAANKEQDLDKTRGFVKYRRQKVVYRPPEQRMLDWDEVTDYQTDDPTSGSRQRGAWTAEFPSVKGTPDARWGISSPSGMTM